MSNVRRYILGCGRICMFADEKGPERFGFSGQHMRITYIGSRLNGAGNDTGGVSLDCGVGADNSRGGLHDTVNK